METTPVTIGEAVVVASSALCHTVTSPSGNMTTILTGIRGESVHSTLPPKFELKPLGTAASVGCGCATMEILQQTVLSSGTSSTIFKHIIMVLIFMSVVYKSISCERKGSLTFLGIGDTPN